MEVLASCAVSELIRTVIESTRSARRYKSECKKLEKELNDIKPDVEKLEKRLGELRTRACNTEHEDIKMVEDWLGRLTRAIELADIEVHKCNSSRLQFDHKLSGRITSMYDEISKIAANRVNLFLQLKQFVREEPSQHGAPLNWSSHNWSCPNSGLDSQDSSLHNGWGYESSGTALLRLMSQQRNGILQQEDHTRLSMGHFDPHLERRHTIDSFHVTQPYLMRKVIITERHILHSRAPLPLSLIMALFITRACHRATFL